MDDPVVENIDPEPRATPVPETGEEPRNDEVDDAPALDDGDGEPAAGTEPQP